MKIWVDDIRPMPSGYDIHCQSVNDTIGVIEYIEKKQKKKGEDRLVYRTSS